MSQNLYHLGLFTPISHTFWVREKITRNLASEFTTADTDTETKPSEEEERKKVR